MPIALLALTAGAFGLGTTEFVVMGLLLQVSTDLGVSIPAAGLLAHGTFFGVGAVVATGLVPPERRASAIAMMFTGLTAATLLGVPAGAWLGLHFGWRSTFWAVAVIGVFAFIVLAPFVPRGRADAVPAALRDELAVLARPQVLLGLAVTVMAATAATACA